jgi:6-pyruvoyltetrahydropterin/6-carboxytetrahydropterin synthase
MLSKHPDKCKFPHGHSRRVECVLEAESLDDREMVCDFKLIKQVIADHLDSYDHALCMNTNDPAFEEFRSRYGDRIIPFENEDPTTEVIAREIFQTLQTSLLNLAEDSNQEYPFRNTEVRVGKVRVWETSSSWAEYYES